MSYDQKLLLKYFKIYSIHACKHSSCCMRLSILCWNIHGELRISIGSFKWLHFSTALQYWIFSVIYVTMYTILLAWILARLSQWIVDLCFCWDLICIMVEFMSWLWTKSRDSIGNKIEECMGGKDLGRLATSKLCIDEKGFLVHYHKDNDWAWCFWQNQCKRSLSNGKGSDPHAWFWF